MNLVLLPGLDGTGQLFSPLLEHLRLDLQTQVIVYPPDKQLSLVKLTDFVREQVQLDKDTILLAEPFSGLVALELLQRDELPIHSLIFSSPQVAVERVVRLRYIHSFPWLASNIFKHL